MLWPNTVPVFKQHHILVDANNYEKDGKRTAFGWLLHLFLPQQEWGIPNRHNLDNAIKEFRRAVPAVRKYPSIEYWEDEQTKSKIVKALNDTMIRLGYTKRCWDDNHERIFRKPT